MDVLPRQALMEMAAFASRSELNVVIETPKDSNAKYKYEEDSGMFAVDKLLPAGNGFPLQLWFRAINTQP